jgi:hypothetical protein
MKKSLLTACVLLLFGVLSCDNDLILNISEPDELIVIDGWIENGQFAKVLLTRNSPYFSTIDSSSIRSLVLTRAKVTVSDGENSEVLILRKNENYFPPFIYEGNEIIGETGKTYTVTAEFGGKTAWAYTTIPPSVALDTVYFKLETESDSLGSLFLSFRDPAETKNYYRIFTKRITRDSRYYSTVLMALDDVYFNGEEFGFSISRGSESILSSFENKYFKLGDTVSVKFCTIDKAHYDFWSSFQEEAFNSGNPFASSLSIIKSNVEGDGLGVWGGYGVSYYNLILK